MPMNVDSKGPIAVKGAERDGYSTEAEENVDVAIVVRTSESTGMSHDKDWQMIINDRNFRSELELAGI